MLRRAEAAAQVMEHLIDHDSHHGYTQGSGRGGKGFETITLTSGEKVTFEDGDTDCSEAIRRCYAAVGVLPFGYWASYMWTGNEHEMLTTHGFKKIEVKDARSMQRGDVLLRNGHTEMYLGNGLQGGARINEKGTITGGKVGDQTGYEVSKSAYTPSRWTAAYRYCGAEKNEQEAGQPVNNAGLIYRIHAQNVGWLPAVRDGQTAGTTGLALRAEAMKITPPEGLELEVTAHIQNIGDKVYKGIKKGESSGTGSSTNDPIIGTTGRGLRLEGFTVNVTKNETKKKLYYRAHVQNVGWQDWKEAGEFAGTRGKALRLEAIQMKLV